MAPVKMQQTDPLESFLAFSELNRVWVYGIAGVLVGIIAWVDWQITSASLGFLYIVPILLASATLNRWQILIFATVCGVLRELFSSLPWTPGGWVRISIGGAGFALAGFFVSELHRKNQLAMRHLKEREEQMQLRHEAEQQLRVVIDTSPLAILTLSSAGRVLLANESALETLGFDKQSFEGRDIQPYLPILKRFLSMQHSSSNLRTTVESRGQRQSGDVFLAHIWLSAYATASGPHLTAFIWDASENLRDREGTGLDSMMATSRVLIGAVSHEIRNLAAAAVSAHHGLASLPGIEQRQQFQALGTIIKGLEKIAASGLRLASEQPAAIANLGMVLDETRVVIEPAFHDSGCSIEWKVANELPLVQADHHSLLQVFLNLARNSQRAIQVSQEKVLTVDACMEHDLVVVRFRDTGAGVSSPEDLFKPFQPRAQAVGLGLYISRAVLRSHGGDLRYEQSSHGACFAVQLWPAESKRETSGS